jgi:hypothetical protein
MASPRPGVGGQVGGVVLVVRQAGVVRQGQVRVFVGRLAQEGRSPDRRPVGGQHAGRDRLHGPPSGGSVCGGDLGGAAAGPGQEAGGRVEP